MKIALLQLNPTVGDIDGNAERIAAFVRRCDHDVDLCVTPEMSLTGYPARDLLLRRGFIGECRRALVELASALAGHPPVLVGTPVETESSEGRPLFNAAALIRDGCIEGTFAKSLLPTYDVFDEDRYFEPGPGAQRIAVGHRDCLLTICEDVWNDRDFWLRRRYHRDPLEAARGTNVSLVINMSASPFTAGKQQLRETMLASLARKHGRALVYVNQVGGNDDLVFDGRSLAFSPTGALLARGQAFDEDVVTIDFDGPQTVVPPTDGDRESETFRALVLGTRDYARKCGFTKAILGLSGGVDSALTAVVAAEALGSENVVGVLMPSPFSSAGSIDDSIELARRLSIDTYQVPIAPMLASYETALAPMLGGAVAGITHENLQARIRGNVLMALANSRGALLLTTGNKSEVAVGYCTLYGDMCGGLAVIADLPKTAVYAVTRWVNRSRPVVPEPVLTKPPSAELRPGQTDEDSLPPYDVLDQILERYIERFESAEAIVEAGFAPDVVHDVIRQIRLAEFKRKQAAPGLKVTERAFGSGWRMPIARGVWETPRSGPR
ncbi:MAG: NAD+ synthase [Vicinamibacterales bacterium]